MSTGVWGIDIGQCALKALRCTLAEDGETVVADAFDYIEYPKILTQPDAEPEVLIQEAIDQFLSRNEVKYDKVAISVSGQSGLARFIKLPPVDSARIADIVKYEAKQQIPFDLNDVIWDYEQLPGGSEEEGFALETEVGLFAMRKDQVFRALKPYEDAGIELDVVQLAPLAIYNFAAYDQIKMLPADQYDPEKPPESVAILSMGSETSDLVITNGYRVWQRNIAVGGNHFTKQLSRDLKLTFAKAEHLKRNARQAEDPKAIFQAMRSVFNDLVQQFQQSLRYFQTVHRDAKVSKLLVVGNPVKLPGLVTYLSKSLGMPAAEIKSFGKLAGAGVVSTPTFQENLPSFCVAYGLCLQGLGKSKLSTSLLPREIIINRMVNEKKPWATAALGALLLAFAFHFFFLHSKWYQAYPERVEAGVSWNQAISSGTQVAATSQSHVSTHEANLQTFEHYKALGTAVVGTEENRLLWLEVLKALNDSLPKDEALGTAEFFKKPYEKREVIYIDRIEAEYFKDLSQWFTEPVQNRYRQELTAFKTGRDVPIETAEPGAESEGGPPPADAAPAPAPAAQPGAAPAQTPVDDEELAPPEGSGWVIEVAGHHYVNDDPNRAGRRFVRDTLIKNLLEGKVDLPRPPGEPPFTVEELGVKYPIFIQSPPIDQDNYILEPLPPGERPERQPGGEPLGPGDSSQPGQKRVAVPEYRFVIQFCWQETPLSERLEKRREKEQQAAEAAAAQEGIR